LYPKGRELAQYSDCHVELDVLQRLRRLPWLTERLRPNDDARSDAALLKQLQKQPDEKAFAAIVERHGPMVLGVCSRYLRQAADMEDAYQAVFLVLLRSLQRGIRQQCLGAWLHEVARRTALHAASHLASLQQRQGALTEEPTNGVEPVEAAMKQEMRAVLDEEIDNLPLRYRQPIVLCQLQGRSKTEAAAELGWPTGTVSGRLARAKELLRSRLVKRGIAPAVALGVVQQSSVAFTSLPLSLSALLTVVKPNVNQLAYGILSMWAIRSKVFWTGIVLSLLLMAGTTGAGAYWLMKSSPTESGETTTSSQSGVESAQADDKELDGMWLEVQRDDVTNEILSVNRLFIKDNKYKLMAGLQVSGRNPMMGFPNGRSGTNFRMETHKTPAPSIDFYGNYFANIQNTGLGGGPGPESVNAWKASALYDLKQDSLKLYFYCDNQGYTAPLPTGVSLLKPQPSDSKTKLLVRTFQRETPEYANGQLKPPSANHPLLREAQPDKAAVESSGDSDELIKLMEKRSALYQQSFQAGRSMPEETIRARLDLLRAKLNHPRASLKEKQQLVAECLKNLEELKTIVMKRYEAGNVPQVELIEAQISLLKARMEFRQFLINEPK